MEKSILLKKCKSISNASKFGYSATSIVRNMVDSLGLQFKEPKTCNIRLKKHIEVVVCKKQLQKEHHIPKMSSVSKSLGVAFLTNVTLAFYFVFLFFFCLT